jgi:hypothetical protein
MEKIIIAGNPKHYVSLSADHHNTYLGLMQMAKDGNYWATVICKELHALLSGQFKPNVFMHQEQGTNGYAVYKMVLPGCTAYLHKDAKGGFYIYRLEASMDYQQMQRDGDKPGLHNVVKGSDSWPTTFVPDGQIKAMPGRIVAVSDQHKNLMRAAEDCAEAITKAPSVGGSSAELSRDGFDMHYTPGPKRFGGMGSLEQRQQAAHPETQASIHESALLLAHTMEQALPIKSVRWITEGGGAGIMTQSLQILKNKGLNFKESQHKIFFCNIRTDLVKADQLARDMGLTTERLTHSRNLLNPDQLFGAGIFAGYTSSWHRYRQEDKHSILKFSADVASETGRMVALPGAFGVGSAATMGLSPEQLLGPSALVFVVAAAPKAIAMGNKLLQAWAPRLHREIMKRF